MTSNGSFFSEIGLGAALLTEWETLVADTNAAAASAAASVVAADALVTNATSSATSASVSAANAAASVATSATSATAAATSATAAATSATASAGSATTASTQASSAASSATAAAGSATTASTQATNASTSATTASTQATTATTQATNAATSATAAATSATASAASATSAATSATNAASFNVYSNLLINPFMEIDQANEGATISASGYAVDGWSYGKAGGSTGTCGRVADGPLSYPNSLKITTTTGSAVTAGTFLYITQALEGSTVTDLAFGTANAQSVTIQFWVKSSITSYVMSVALINAANNRSYVANVTVTAANTWQLKSVTIPGDTSGSWVMSTTNVGLSLVIAAAVGSTFQATVNTWSAGNFFGTSANTNTINTTNSATFQITGVKLEVGANATVIRRRPVSEEFLLCQRYYRKSYELGTSLATTTNAGELYTFMAGLTSATNNASIGVTFHPPMRSAPTMTFYSPSTGTSGKGRDLVNSSDVTPSTLHASSTGAQMGMQLSSASTSVSFTLHYTADARL